MKKSHIFAIIGVCALGFAAYSIATGDRWYPEKAVGEPTAVTFEGMEAVIAANNAFAFDVYSQLATDDENIFFSPYSLSTALGMTYEGARGQTADEMASTLRFSVDDDFRRAATAVLQNGYNDKTSLYRLEIANALWAQEDFDFSSDFLNLVTKFYAGRATNLDFKNDAEGSREEINSWVESRTNSKIKNLFPKGTVDANTRLILTNAVYFKGMWMDAFDKGETYEGDFTILSGEKVKARLMHKGGKSFGYTDGNGAQVLELPYQGGELSMLLMLPEGEMNELEEKLSADVVRKYREDLIMQEVDITLPRFELDTKYSMNEALSKIGMPTAFTDSADFSGMTDEGSLAIGNVVHQAYVAVDEEGTEAAAAAGVEMSVTSFKMIAEPKIFRADRPFIFAITDKESGNILFLGRVSNPAQ
jgi:serpin B